MQRLGLRPTLSFIVGHPEEEVGERWDTLKEAYQRGLRTFVMLSPCLPGIADSAEALKDMMRRSLIPSGSMFGPPTGVKTVGREENLHGTGVQLVFCT